MSTFPQNEKYEKISKWIKNDSILIEIDELIKRKTQDTKTQKEEKLKEQ